MISGKITPPTTERTPDNPDQWSRASRRLLLASAAPLALAACSGSSVSMTVAQIVAELQAAQSALDTLITVVLPASVQAKATSILAAFTEAARAVGAAVSAGASNVNTLAVTAGQTLTAVLADLAPLLPSNASGILTTLEDIAQALAVLGSLSMMAPRRRAGKLTIVI